MPRPGAQSIRASMSARSDFPEARLGLGRSVYDREGPDLYRVKKGYERGELLRIVRDEAGTPTKMYFATYPVTRTPETLG